jgi:hypothetical protein
MIKNMGLVLEDNVSIQSTCCQNVSIFLGFIDMRWVKVTFLALIACIHIKEVFKIIRLN